MIGLIYVLRSALVIDGSSVYAQRPPTRSRCSNPVTLNPSSRNVFSVDSPHVPVTCQLMHACWKWRCTATYRHQ
jgi:hypothetical protein